MGTTSCVLQLDQPFPSFPRLQMQENHEWRYSLGSPSKRLGTSILRHRCAKLENPALPNNVVRKGFISTGTCPSDW